MSHNLIASVQYNPLGVAYLKSMVIKCSPLHLACQYVDISGRLISSEDTIAQHSFFNGLTKHLAYEETQIITNIICIE